MVCKGYWAVTEKEMSKISNQPLAWLACRFDKRGYGLENLPPKLPKGALILVDDLQPIGSHSPARIAKQLTELCSRYHPAGIVLDLERRPMPRALQMVKHLTRLEQVPVAVTPAYARELDCPVFLTAPMHKKLPQLLAPWKDREIWLDLPMGQWAVTRGIPEPMQTPHSGPWGWDRFLCCGYVKTGSDTYVLCRNQQMLPKILEEAGRLGVPRALLLASELSGL